MLKLVSRMIASRDGNIAIMFAFFLAPLLMFAGGAVDFARYNAVKTDLVESLDAAGLAMAQLDALNGPEIRNLSDSAREDYLKQYGKDFFTENFMHKDIVNGLKVDFQITKTKITPKAEGTISTLILHVVDGISLGGSSANFNEMSMATSIEITRAATGNTEVALVLDTTGSMNNGTKMADLRAAATEFVDVLVRGDQRDYYSKVAIVPYGGSVNLGTDAVAARGAVRAPAKITTVARIPFTYACGYRNSSTCTGYNPLVTAPGHGFANGDTVVIKNVQGMSEINSSNEKVYRVRDVTPATFTLRTVSSSNSEGGQPTVSNAYVSGGDIYCTNSGCQYKWFRNDTSSGWRLFEVTNCVSERTGVEAFSDAAPTTAKLGYVYGPIGGAYMCPPSRIAALTDNRQTAKNTIAALAANGNTGGHVGVAWGWYAVSPNFSNLFTSDSAPASYTDDVAKSIVIMTDGEYNSSYCDGVVSRNSTSGSGGASDHIRCDAENGHSYNQSLQLCKEMKKAGVTVYTVGFQIVDSQSARDLMSQCASGPSYAYLAEDGAALKRVFADIAQNIAQLHISK